MNDPNAAFAPPSDPASLYVGDVMHARLKPVAHRFSYRVFCLVMDLDRLGEADRSSRLFSVNGRNLVSFEDQAQNAHVIVLQLQLVVLGVRGEGVFAL